MYTFISTLISAGWTKVMDSDGTTYSVSGSQVTSGESGTNGLANTKAWVRLRAPAVNHGAVANQTREITIQRGTIATNVDWRVKYSASAGFNVGSPAALVTPSADDEVFMIGGGTDASPTFTAWFVNFADGVTPQRVHIIAGGAAEMYTFALWMHDVGTPVNNRGAFCLDIMAPGSYSALDIDPAVMYFSTSNSAGFSDMINAAAPTINSTAPALARTWLGPTSAAGASITSNNVNVRMLPPGNIGGANATVGTNPWANSDDLFPCLYVSANALLPRGIKGFSTLFMFGSVSRNNMTICDSLYTGSKDKVYFSGVWLPWSGDQPLI